MTTSKNSIANNSDNATRNLTVGDIKAFAASLKVGDQVEAVLPFRRWTSTTNFDTYYKKARVTIAHKYPYLVEVTLVDKNNKKEIFTWFEMMTGYYGAGGSGRNFDKKVDKYTDMKADKGPSVEFDANTIERAA